MLLELNLFISPNCVGSETHLICFNVKCKPVFVMGIFVGATVAKAAVSFPFSSDWQLPTTQDKTCIY